MNVLMQLKGIWIFFFFLPPSPKKKEVGGSKKENEGTTRWGTKEFSKQG